MAILSLGLAALPLRGHAEPAPVEAEGAPEGEVVPEGEAAAEAATAPEVAEAFEPTPEGEASDEESSADEASAEGETSPAEATEASDDEAVEDAEGNAAADAAAAPGALGPTAEPLRPMQTAAWWTMFGAFAVGTTAGVLAGLAERQEDRATRLSTLFDAQTGAQPLYADRKGEYEEYLRRGEGFAKAAIGVGVVAGAATIAAITLFAIDAKRQRSERAPREKQRASLRVRGGGVEVRF